MDNKEDTPRPVVGGVDTHKDLRVAAVVDDQDKVLGTRSFPTTWQGYRQMLAWMRDFGSVQRIGVESTGSYSAGLPRSLRRAGVEVLEVTAPDQQDRRRRGKNDDIDAENAPVPPSPASEPFLHARATDWWKLSGFSRRAERPRWLRAASRSR